MIRPIATTLSLALFCTSAAWAEDRAQSGAAAGQDQSSSSAAAGAQSDKASDTAAKGAGASDAAAPAQDQAQAAAGREAGGEQDPTKAFVKDLYSANQFEVQLGQLAAQKAQDDQIKQFARMMVQDHQKANQQLKQIAQSAQVQVQDQLDPVHQAKLQKFQQIPASQWDRKYINSQAAAHMMSVLELRYESQNAQDPAVKQFAAQQLPGMEKHLKMATDIATKQAGGEARTAGERESGTGRDAAGETGTGTSGERGAGTSGERGAEKSGQSEEGAAGATPKNE